MMVMMKIYLEDEPLRTQFYQLVRLCDAVKFAKYIPEPGQQDFAIATSKKTFEYLDQLSYRIKQKNAY